MKEVLKEVKKVEITTRNLVDGIVAGNYHSLFKGNGIEFSEIREYIFGDDVRTIDWKVTARFNRPFVKEFIEERDLRVYFLFDFSASGSFGSTIEKRRKAIYLTATLMFSAIRNNDNAGMLIFTEDVEKFFPARKGKKHVLMMIRNLLTYEPRHKGTNLRKALQFIGKVVKRRSVIFIISDFMDNLPEREMLLLKRKHDVIAVRMIDERELEMPNVGLIELEDEETGEQILVDTSDEKFRENYGKIVSEDIERIKSIFNKMGVGYIEVNTSQPFENALRKFFKRRKNGRV